MSFSPRASSDGSRANALHEEAELIGRASEPAHALDDPRENLGVAHGHRKRIVERVVVPVHFGKAQRRAAGIVPCPVSGVTYQPQGPRRATGALEVGVAIRDSLYLPMRPQQRLARSDAYRSSTRNGIGRRLAFCVARATLDAHAAPAHILDHLKEIDGFAKVKRFHRTVDLARLELRCLVHHDPTGRAPRVTPPV